MRRHAASSFIIGFRRRHSQFALLFPPADGTAFRRGSFGSLRPARLGDHATEVRTYRRPPTFCAHRLRRPNRNSNTSDALCRGTSPRLTGSNPRLAGTASPLPGKGVLASVVVKRRLRRPCHTRCTELAACLRQRALSTPERLPSVRSRSRDPAGEVAFVVHVRVPRLAPCRSPRAWPASPKAGRSFRAIARRADPHRLPRASPCSRERCVSPTSATDSRHEHPVRCPIPDLAPFLPRSPRRLSTPWTTDPSGSRIRVELRLTATLQLQLCHNRSDVSRSRSPDPRLNRAPRRSGRASIESSSAPCLPTAALSTARRACSLASGVLLHGRLARPDLSTRSAPTSAGLRLCRRLVKDSRVVETRTPSLDECALPCFPGPVHRLRGHRSQ